MIFFLFPQYRNEERGRWGIEFDLPDEKNGKVDARDVGTCRKEKKDRASDECVMDRRVDGKESERKRKEQKR